MLCTIFLNAAGFNHGLRTTGLYFHVLSPFSVCNHILFICVTLVVQMVRNPPVVQETQVQFLVGEDPLETGMATFSSILAWRTP